ncbi:IS66 family transposase [Salmonella enterica subsp. enterica serovar Newport]|nr:IS66 family transposase [Salmonella enterica subsp. enterica serovar Newport]
MNSSRPDNIDELKRLLAEQETLNRALLEKLNEREREIDHLQAQLDKLRRMNFGSHSEKVSRRIAQMEADLNQLQKESDTLTGRVNDPAVQRPLRQTRTRKPFPESLPRDEKRLLPAASCCPECGGALSYLGEDAAEQLELMRSVFRVIRIVREKHACTQCDAIAQAAAPSRPIERGIAGPGLLALTDEALKRIGELYTVEAEIRGMPAEQRLAERERKTKPLLKSLESWLREKMKTLSRHSELAKAFTYALNQWPALAYYAEDGWAEADNNIAENALRMVSLGRKNWLFFGSDHGGERGALLYSLIGTCKLNGVDPEGYLRHVLDVIADWPVNRVSELLPWRITLPTE